MEYFFLLSSQIYISLEQMETPPFAKFTANANWRDKAWPDKAAG